MTITDTPITAPALPEPRGPLSGGVIGALRRAPASAPLPATGRVTDPLGEDAQLALYVCYELHYRGFDGVDAAWEWEPALLAARAGLEAAFLNALRTETTGGDRPAAGRFGAGRFGADEPGAGGPGAGEVTAVLDDLLVERVDEDGVSHFLRDHGEPWQLREYVAHRSIYHLKEADPHAWVIPRLGGRAKAALVAVEYDEFGGGRAEMMHSRLYAGLMAELGLDPGYGAYLDQAPAQTLATVNMMSLFGLHRALRGALVGHFAAAEITTAPTARRMDQALRRLGVGPRGTLFFTEHIEADAVHEQVLRRDVLGDLLAAEPALAADVVLGVRATGFLEARLGAHLLGAWRAAPPRSSLRSPLDPVPAPMFPPARPR
jgi:hypothetical protein